MVPATRVRVLVIDDNENHRLLMRMAMEERGGWDVRESDGLEEAIRDGALAASDVVVLDLNMPGTHGSETIRRFREIAPHKPVVCVTAAEEPTPGAYRAAGADDHLDKGAISGGRLRRKLLTAIRAHVDTPSDRPMRVMVVENDDLDAALLTRALDVLPFRHVVERVLKLEDAIYMAKLNPQPGLVFLDLNLEDSTGDDTFYTFQRECPTVPVIVWSGEIDSAMAIGLMRATTVIQKEMSMERIVLRTVNDVASGRTLGSVPALSSDQRRALADAVQISDLDPTRLEEAIAGLQRCIDAGSTVERDLK